MSKKLRPGATHAFMPFKMFHLARVQPTLYSTTCTIGLDGGYCVTVDFQEEQCRELLEVLTSELAKQIKDAFAVPFTDVIDLQFPEPVEVAITARLGQPINNDGEEFIPFVATRVFRHKE